MPAPRSRSTNLSRRSLLMAAPLVAVGGAAWLAGPARGFTWGATADPHGALGLGGPWLNSAPLGPEQMRGKVVLVNFWTYTCINSLRTLPYLRAWADKYRDRGLVVIGAHAPEFSFEGDLANVRRAVADLNVTWPVVLDNDLRVWSAYGNDGWPGFFFVDATGRVRRHALGEGDYERSERLLQELLAEAGGRQVMDPIAPVAGVGPQAAPDWDHIGSQETYVGYAKAERFASESGLRRDVAHDYPRLARLPLNRWSLTGAWTAGPEATTLTGASGTLAFRFRSRDLHLVMAPPSDGEPVRFRVRIDGAAPGADHGFDTDAQGWGRLDAPRMYQLVRQSRTVVERTFEIEFLGTGARAYAFTFG